MPCDMPCFLRRQLNTEIAAMRVMDTRTLRKEFARVLADRRHLVAKLRSDGVVADARIAKTLEQAQLRCAKAARRCKQFRADARQAEASATAATKAAERQVAQVRHVSAHVALSRVRR